MNVVYCKKTRRQFLVGAGNTLLALPFLPSLFSSEANAQAAAPNEKKMMVFLMDHNMLNEYWVRPALATTNVGSSGSKELLLSSLASMNAMSPLLTDPIYNTLRMNDQMTIVRNMNITDSTTGHENYGGMGGSYSNGQLYYPTFDTIVEASSSVYPASTPVSVTKVIRVCINGGTLSIRKVGTSAQAVIPYGFDQDDDSYTTRYYTLPVMYTDVFKSLTNGTVNPADTTNKLKTNILNRVFQSFTSFRGNRRISSDDLAQIDQHMGFLSDLQRTVASIAVPTNSCAKPDSPIATRDPVVFNALYLNLLAVAFKCGLTKMAAMKFEGHDPKWLPGLSLPSGTDLHGAIHGGNDSALWALKRHAHETLFKYDYNTIGKNFLTSLNQMEGSTGRTYLDNMVTAVLPQFGMEDADGGSGHGGDQAQAMLIGSMGGKVRSGRFVLLPGWDTQRLPYNSMLVTLLDLMGVPASEYSKYSNTGKGFGDYPSSAGHSLASRFYGPISEILAA